MTLRAEADEARSDATEETEARTQQAATEKSLLSRSREAKSFCKTEFSLREALVR